MALLLFITLIVTILILSGLVSGSEAALLSLSYAKSKELAKRAKKSIKSRAAAVVHIKENMQKYITTIVILNNVINITGSIYVGILATKIFAGSDLMVGITSAAMTFMIITFSEIIPKLYGERYSAEISLRIAKPLLFIGWLFTPLVYVFDKISNTFVKDAKRNNISEGEILEMAILGTKEGSINNYENEVISKVFEMNDIEVYDIMIPKNKVVKIFASATFDEVANLSSKTGYTRFPVAKADGEIIGMINAKDLFRFYNRKEDFSVLKILRSIIYASEYMKISTLEAKFKKERNHMAIVINEHGDYTGIVTLEDIIEELLGEIEDEFDTKEKPIIKVAENTYHIKGDADMEFVNNKFNLRLNLDDEDYTTLNGYLITSFGRIPKTNEKISLPSTNIRILKSNRKRVIQAELKLK